MRQKLKEADWAASLRARLPGVMRYFNDGSPDDSRRGERNEWEEVNYGVSAVLPREIRLHSDRY